MTVLPVTKMESSGTLSARRFCSEVFVGAKLRSAMQPVSRRFISSGNGEYLLCVRSPASTWPTVVWW